jgi:Mlc titration factor MtfA (ptsG expression regulator)
MRAQRPHDRWFFGSLAALALVAGLVVGAIMGGPALYVGGGIGIGGAASLALALRRRTQRRRAVLASPFPAEWRALLEGRYDHFERLPAPLKARFEDDVRVFLAEKRITGVEVEVTDELRLLVAASAVTLSLGWPDYEWDQLTEVLLYPQDFGRDYSFEATELSGQAHAWGTVILSVPTLRESFHDPDDGFHVGLHEFAHLLDLEQARFAGIPAGLRGEGEWFELVEKEMDRLRRGKSALDPYGDESPAEFLAVAVEAFFEMPLLLARRHQELYAVLKDYFRQDPAAWDDARGLWLTR